MTCGGSGCCAISLKSSPIDSMLPFESAWNCVISAFIASTIPCAARAGQFAVVERERGGPGGRQEANGACQQTPARTRFRTQLAIEHSCRCDDTYATSACARTFRRYGRHRAESLHGVTVRWVTLADSQIHVAAGFESRRGAVPTATPPAWTCCPAAADDAADAADTTACDSGRCAVHGDVHLVVCGKSR